MTSLGSILNAYGVHVPRLRLSREVIAAAMSWANPPARGAVTWRSGYRELG
jgi:hypothetical protein